MLFRCLILLAWLACAGPARADDIPAIGASAPLPLHLADEAVVSLDHKARYWIEPAREKTVAEIEMDNDALPWLLRQPGQQYHVDGRALWLQFDALIHDSRRWYLQVAASGVDRVQLFHRDGSGRWVMQEAGDARAVPDWPLPGRVPTFELSPQSAPGQPVRYWLRVEHARTNFAAPIAVLAQGELLASREREQFLLGAYFGLALLITFVSLANALVYRDRNFVAYAAYVTTLTVGQIAYLGVGAQHLWPHWLAWNAMATFVLPGLSSAVGLWFVRTVTEPARYSRRLDQATWGLIAALLAAVALDTFAASRPTFALVMVLTLSAMGLVAALILRVWRHGEDPYIRLIALGFLPVLVLALFPVARGLNLIPASFWTRYALSIGAALEMPILFYAINLRGHRRREAQLRAVALSHTDALTGLYDHRTFLLRLDGAITRARGQRHACALLVVDLTNHEAITREFGAEMGDRALVVAASHLRHVISDVDLAARIAARHFAVLLEGPTTPHNAKACAQYMVARGLASSGALPPTVTLNFHVVVAMLPDSQDAAQSVALLLKALHAIDPEERRPIRTLNF